MHSHCVARDQLEPKQPLFEVSRSHTIRHMQPVGLHLANDQPVTEKEHKIAQKMATHALQRDSNPRSQQTNNLNRLNHRDLPDLR
jgi:hypothetical protein